ncbi:uncharacterized protein DS421_20g708280 [Arachis hypogaea]|nr:uncharacterized protein DS421_20g708280 [Arachis hypogaea]
MNQTDTASVLFVASCHLLHALILLFIYFESNVREVSRSLISCYKIVVGVHFISLLTI